MKKNILIGIFSPLLYFLMNNIIRFTIFAGEYNEQYALLDASPKQIVYKVIG